jgi:hypothetical protein
MIPARANVTINLRLINNAYISTKQYQKEIRDRTGDADVALMAKHPHSVAGEEILFATLQLTSPASLFRSSYKEEDEIKVNLSFCIHNFDFLLCGLYTQVAHVL